MSADTRFGSTPEAICENVDGRCPFCGQQTLEVKFDQLMCANSAGHCKTKALHARYGLPFPFVHPGVSVTGTFGANGAGSYQGGMEKVSAHPKDVSLGRNPFDPSGDDDDKPLPFRTAAQIAAETSPEVTWFVPGYVGEGIVTELVGLQKKSGKTTWLLEAVGACLKQQPFLGVTPPYTPVVILTEQPKASF